MRGIQVLQDVDTIAAEDTRHTGKLLHHFQIKTPQISYHQHNEQQRIPELISQLESGKSIALVTDAFVRAFGRAFAEAVHLRRGATVRLHVIHLIHACIPVSCFSIVGGPVAGADWPRVGTRSVSDLAAPRVRSFA